MEKELNLGAIIDMAEDICKGEKAGPGIKPQMKVYDTPGNSIVHDDRHQEPSPERIEVSRG